MFEWLTWINSSYILLGTEWFGMTFDAWFCLIMIARKIRFSLCLSYEINNIALQSLLKSTRLYDMIYHAKLYWYNQEEYQNISLWRWIHIHSGYRVNQSHNISYRMQPHFCCSGPVCMVALNSSPHPHPTPPHPPPHPQPRTKWPPFRRRYFQCFFVNWKFYIVIKISLKFVPKGPINHNLALV